MTQAYKNVRKIIKLVKLLGSLRQGEKEEEAVILSLVADFAMKAADFDACLTICDILMTSHKTSPAAVNVCAKLVRNTDFQNVEAKARLSSFCVTYCSNETIGSDLFVGFFSEKLCYLYRNCMYKLFTYSLLSLGIGNFNSK